MLTQMALTSSWHTHILLPCVYHQPCAERMLHISFILHSCLNPPSCSSIFFYKAGWAKCVERADLWTLMDKGVKNCCSRGNSVMLFRGFLQPLPCSSWVGPTDTQSPISVLPESNEYHKLCSENTMSVNLLEDEQMNLYEQMIVLLLSIRQNKTLLPF